MRFLAALRARMVPRVKVRVVINGEAFGFKRRFELLAYAIRDPCGHGVDFAPKAAPVKARARILGKLVMAGAKPHTLSMPRSRLADYSDPVRIPLRSCDHPGCTATGEYRAPRSRAELDHFYWFCLDHVRAYNAAWNFYAGMSTAEIEAEIRSDTVWQRPTWPLGARIGALYGARWRGFGVFDLDEDGTGQRETRAPRPRSPQEKALALFDLRPPLTLAGLKARYKELVKRHHPDTHGGDRAAEERLKEINEAYSTLKASYFPS